MSESEISFDHMPDVPRKEYEAMRRIGIEQAWQNTALRACVQRLADGWEPSWSPRGSSGGQSVRVWCYVNEDGIVLRDDEPMTPAEAAVMREVLDR